LTRAQACGFAQARGALKKADDLDAFFAGRKQRLVCCRDQPVEHMAAKFAITLSKHGTLP
jgi:hypothetical protein